MRSQKNRYYHWTMRFAVRFDDETGLADDTWISRDCRYYHDDNNNDVHVHKDFAFVDLHHRDADIEHGWCDYILV